MSAVVVRCWRDDCRRVLREVSAADIPRDFTGDLLVPACPRGHLGLGRQHWRHDGAFLYRVAWSELRSEVEASEARGRAATVRMKPGATRVR